MRVYAIELTDDVSQRNHVVTAGDRRPEGCGFLSL